MYILIRTLNKYIENRIKMAFIALFVFHNLIYNVFFRTKPNLKTLYRILKMKKLPSSKNIVYILHDVD